MVLVIKKYKAWSEHSGQLKFNMEITNPILITILSTLGGLLGGYLGAYAKKKGANLATKEDFNELLAQVRQTTEATETIKARISQDAAVAQSDLEFCKQQLSEFYGPLYAYTKLNAEIYDIWMDHKLEDINVELIALFRKQNEEAVQILSTKLHLVEGDKTPPEFARFMSSVTLWNLYTARPNHEVPDHVVALPQAKYPVEFDHYIFETTERLKNKLDSLHRKYGIT